MKGLQFSILPREEFSHYAIDVMSYYIGYIYIYIYIYIYFFVSVKLNYIPYKNINMLILKFSLKVF